MVNFPTVFVSHGAPNIVIEPSEANTFLKQLGQKLGKPEAILAISAHWGTEYPMVTGTSQPQTIHDFSGFSPELYQLHYAAPGNPNLASQVADLLTSEEIDCGIDPTRGFDHGVWTPLMLMYPTADIPVVQLSIQPRRSPKEHLSLGQALTKIRDRGVLVLASGSATHNLRELTAPNSPPPIWVKDFDRWLTSEVIAGKVEELTNFQTLAPHASHNHPTIEHLLPLFVAMGASPSAKGRLLHSSFTYGVLSMSAYAFD